MPVATSDKVLRPERGDPESVRTALRAAGLPTPSPLDELSPLEQEDLLYRLGLLPPDDDPLDLRTQDLEPWQVDPDPVDSWGQPRDTTWTLDLHDPYLWADPAA